MQINVKDKVRRKDIANLFLQIWYKCYFFYLNSTGCFGLQEVWGKKGSGHSQPD